MATQLDICNSALIKLGVEPVTSISGTEKAARLCKASYNMIRDELLASHYWNFAMKRAALVVATDSPVYEYSYKYDLPTDCLRIHSLGDRGDFKIEGKYIVTNIDSAYALYISSETDTTKFPPTFSEALAYRLAANLSYALVQSVSLGENMHKLSDIRLRDARSFDGQEGTLGLIQADEWLGSRFTGPFYDDIMI